MRLERKQIVFIIVMLILCATVVYRILNPFEQARVNKLTHSNQVRKSDLTKDNDLSVQAVSKKEPVDIVDRFLTKQKPEFLMTQDLFKIYKPSQKKIVQPNNLLSKKIKVVQKKSGIGKSDPIKQVKDYITSYTYHGFYESQEQKAVFLSKDKLVLVAWAGDRLDGKYLIDDIQNKYIKIKALELNETIYLDLREFNNDE